LLFFRIFCHFLGIFDHFSAKKSQIEAIFFVGLILSRTAKSVNTGTVLRPDGRENISRSGMASPQS